MPRLFFFFPRIFLVLTIAAFLFVVEARGAGSCLAVRGQWVTAGDLAPAAPEFGSLAPNLAVLGAPVGLARRWLKAAELSGIASKLGILLDEKTGDLCLEQAKTAISREQILDQMRTKLSITDLQGNVSLELVSFFPREAPQGVLIFESSSLTPSCLNGGCSLYNWKGALRFTEGGSMAFNAQVRIEVDEQLPVADKNLLAGVKIEPTDFSVVVRKRPWRPAPVQPVLDPVGQVVLRSIKQGTPITRHALRKPQEVEKGETVEVRVKSGRLELITQAKAETGGKSGDRVVVSNPTSHRRFMAEITGPGRVRTISQGDNQ